MSVSGPALFGSMIWVYRWYKPGGKLGHVKVAEQYLAMLYGGLLA